MQIFNIHKQAELKKMLTRNLVPRALSPLPPAGANYFYREDANYDALF